MDYGFFHGGMLSEEAGQSYLELGNLLISIGNGIWDYCSKKPSLSKSGSELHCGGCLCKYPTLTAFLNEDDLQDGRPEFQNSAEKRQENATCTEVDLHVAVDEIEMNKGSKFLDAQLKQVNDEYSEELRKIAEESEIIIKNQRRLLKN